MTTGKWSVWCFRTNNVNIVKVSFKLDLWHREAIRRTNKRIKLILIQAERERIEQEMVNQDEINEIDSQLSMAE